MIASSAARSTSVTKSFVPLVADLQHVDVQRRAVDDRPGRARGALHGDVEHGVQGLGHAAFGYAGGCREDAEEVRGEARGCAVRRGLAACRCRMPGDGDEQRGPRSHDRNPKPAQPCASARLCPMAEPDPTRFVLLHTSHGGNVGAAARAMKVMGFSDLVLVARACQTCSRARRRVAFASGATDVLEARARRRPRWRRRWTASRTPAPRR
jgi:hypothetical protein